jgi:protein-S-isoprenylcysteine O-methyltransferase Ste14
MRETLFVAARTLLFTVFVPGTVLVVVPYMFISGEDTAGRLDFGPFRYLGAIGIVVGASLYAACAWQFTARGRGTPAPYDPPKRLVVRGPYRIVRNPMYAGVLSIGYGIGIWFESPGTLAFCAFMTLVFMTVVVLYEEPVLREKFGVDYDRYCAEVPRFIPRLVRRKQSDDSTRDN